jgi:hypothetical protein
VDAATVGDAGGVQASSPAAAPTSAAVIAKTAAPVRGWPSNAMPSTVASRR